MFLLFLIISGFGIWLLCQISWRLLAWTFKPLVDYCDEKETRQLASIDELGRRITESMGASVATNIPSMEEQEEDDTQKKCPLCGVPLDTGSVESFLHGESANLSCPLCAADIVREDLLS